MRRPVVIGSISALVVVLVATAGLLLWGSPSAPPLTPTSGSVVSFTPTPSPTQTPSLSTHEADLTHWAQVATITPTPSPTSSTDGDNTRWAEVQSTADAYATAHANDLGDLEVPFDYGGIHPRVTFSEAEFNALAEPYAAQVENFRDVFIDLVPGGGTLTGSMIVLGIPVDVRATARLRIENGSLQIEIPEASIAGIAPPAATLESINDDLVEMVSGAIYDGLAEYAPPELIMLTGVTVTDDSLTVAFIPLSPDH